MKAMIRSERLIVILLRLAGVSGLLALPAVFLPFAWMDWIHARAGLGAMPEAPIVHYLARSLSAFYVVVGAMALMISSDIRRYRPFVRLLGFLAVGLGAILLGIDLHAGLPIGWVLGEGPPTAAAGVLILWLERHIASGD